MKKVAIIPARGGSKRLPRKNVLPILGKPMFAYPIQAALQSGMFERVLVSTEDEEIRGAALEAGAEDVCKHVLEILDENNALPDYFCCLYATAIFITPEDLKKSFQLFKQDPTPDVVMGVSDFNLHPVQALEEKDGFLSPKWPEYRGVQSQFHPKLVASNGTLYWARTNYFVKNPSFYCSRLKGYKIPKQRSIDMDTQEDFAFAQLVAENLFGK
jgi:N-acylneuraminate cytidylyltransferase